MLRFYLIQIIIQRIDGTIICTTTPGQSGPGSNGNERLLHTTPDLQNWKRHHQMQFTVLTQETSFLCVLEMWYSQYIVSSADNAICQWNKSVKKQLVWFLYLMAYQPSWVIQSQSHPWRRTVLVLSNLKDKGIYAFSKGINLTGNIVWILSFAF